MSVLV